MFVFDTNAQVQTQKGTFFLTGEISFYRNKAEIKSRQNSITSIFEIQMETSFTFLPSVGYMLTDNWAIGLGLGFEREYARFFIDDFDNFLEDYNTILFIISPFARYYYGLNEKLSIFDQSNFLLTPGDR
ncbi:MAG: hypothetical protein DDT42_01829 [candidate division WS2 bacterium]|uniref:Uncharacterized protein n=1 Tax=Psychracetigena formicireducens TaxID=2986056 RepID=A0A9E2BI00_PSYF1|nr:hypothetical protein [Candidatus Psychracetigena formicireducens]